MVNSTGSVASLLSGVYQDSSSSLAKSLQRISTGKRVTDASDDMGAFLKASTYSSNVQSLNTQVKELQTGKGYADAAKAVGNAVVSTITKMADLQSQYAKTSDSNVQDGLNMQFAAQLSSLTELIANGTYAGNSLYVATAIGAANFSGYVVQSATVATVAGVGTNAANATGAAAELTKASKYVATISSIGDTLADAIKLKTSIVQSYQGAISSLTDVNEAEEQLNITSQQVRMQATAAMMSQANTATAAIARLFQ